MRITTYRRLAQVAFILFIFLMPVLNILRFDSATGELIIFGQAWSLGLRELGKGKGLFHYRFGGPDSPAGGQAKDPAAVTNCNLHRDHSAV